MDDERFDIWTRGFDTLRTRASRRAGLRLLASGGFVIALQQLGSPVTDAKDNHKKKKKRPQCPNAKKRCGNLCINKDLCCTSKDCPGCDKCYSDGKCGGPDLYPLCSSDACQVLACDVGTNEWECVEACGPNEDCCHGVCQPYSERCCAKPGWKVCPGGDGACCDDLGQCTKNGRYCCAEGLVACDQVCAIGSC